MDKVRDRFIVEGVLFELYYGEQGIDYWVNRKMVGAELFLLELLKVHGHIGDEVYNAYGFLGMMKEMIGNEDRVD